MGKWAWINAWSPLGGINSGKPTQWMHAVPNAKYPLAAAAVRQAVLGQKKAALAS